VKRERQRALMRLIDREELGSQEDIRHRLAELGHPATQSTISRDLDELGLIRIRNGAGRFRYVTAGNGGAAANVSLDSLLQEFAVAVEQSGNILLIKTHPGAANAVAQGLDRSGLDGLLGTVAGDDTIIAIARTDRAGRQLLRRLRGLGGFG
jgi:transcriptional regulator of arginine metabolism